MYASVWAKLRQRFWAWRDSAHRRLFVCKSVPSAKNGMDLASSVWAKVRQPVGKTTPAILGVA
jgi:hypothetical protein